MLQLSCENTLIDVAQSSFLPSLLFLASNYHKYEIFIIKLTNYVHAFTVSLTVAYENTNDCCFGTQITNELTN